MQIADVLRQMVSNLHLTWMHRVLEKWSDKEPFEVRDELGISVLAVLRLLDAEEYRDYHDTYGICNAPGVAFSIEVRGHCRSWS